MGILGKDLLDLDRPATHTKVLFGGDGYWIEYDNVRHPYGTALTELLDFDATDYHQNFSALCALRNSGDPIPAAKAFRDVAHAFAQLPYYRFFLSLNHPRVYEPLLAGPLSIDDPSLNGQVSDTELGKSVLADFDMAVQKYRWAEEDLRLIQSRYTWFLDELFKNAEPEKKKGQRKKPLAVQLYEANLEPYVSGTSLGQSRETDPPKVEVQYVVVEPEDGDPELAEKMYFDRLADFVYVELMKGLQKGFVPKRCNNCGRWFLQEPGMTYSYCDREVEGEPGVTCRQIGSRASFKSKVQNNDVWKVHQRAYKKYFARIRAKTMTKTDFEIWARAAEGIRDRALKEYKRAGSEEKKREIVERVKKELNRP